MCAPCGMLVTRSSPVILTAGTEVSPGEARRPPTLSWLAEEDRYYAVLLVDPDAPSREDPRMGEWVSVA